MIWTYLSNALVKESRVFFPFLQVNGFIAGAVAGATVAARTRSWKQVVGMAGLVSACSAAADYYKAI